MKKNTIICIVLFLLSNLSALMAQVTIGSNNTPSDFSALEIISSNGGLRHPQMTTAERDKLLENVTDRSAAQGLTIFNTDVKCIEFYKNDAEGWINLCNEQDASLIPLDTDATLRAYLQADGTLTSGDYGKKKYDVAQINEGGSCGTLSAEGGRAGDFKNSTHYTRNYVVEFTNITGISNLTVGKYQDPYGIIESVSGNVSGTLTSTQNRLLVKFSSNINDLAKGTSENNALKATIYGIFNKDGEYKRVEYTITVMDCLGCGIRVSTDQSWMPMMCYNLEADESKDPFTYTYQIEGASYQWGRPRDGHEDKTSDIFYPYIPLGKVDYPTSPKDELDSRGHLKPSSPRYGLFIPTAANCEAYFHLDWCSQHSSKIWGDGTQRLVVRKGTADPCPSGFRLPTYEEMMIIERELEVVDSAQGAIAKGDGILFLPYSWFRDSDGYESTDAKAQYWTSTMANPTAVPDIKDVWALHLSTSDNYTKQLNHRPRSNSGSVRCIAE